MTHDLSASAQVVWHPDEDEPPEDWSDATDFPTLSQAVEAVVTGAPQTGHPWIRCRDRVIAPREIEALWQEPEEF